MKGDGDSRMIKYGVGGTLLALFASLSAWIVAAEGETYRKGLKESLASKGTSSSSSSTTSRQDSIKRKPKPPVPSSPPESELAEETVPPPAQASKPKPPVVVAERTPEPKPTTSPPVAIPTPSSPPPPGPAAPPAPPLDPFWNEPEQKKSWDLDHLTVEDERQLGQSLNQMILRFHPPLDNGPLPKRLEDAIEPYLKSVTRKDVNYTFTVLDCDSTNVFSHPGGYVYVCRGLFDWIAKDEDYALEFILLHEMAHVDLAHAIICLRDPEMKKLELGTVPQFYFFAIPWGYKPQMELDADRWAMDRMTKQGRSRYEILSFLRKLEDYSRKNGFENRPKKPMDEPKVPYLDNHIRAHPIPRNRLKALKGIMDPPLKT